MFNSKIKINAVDFYNIKEDNIIKLVENDKILLSNCIIGIKEFKQYSWEEKLKLVKLYIETNDKLPSAKDKNKDIKQLGWWISDQKKNYSKYQYIMKEENIRNKWEDFINTYAHLFMSNYEKWNDTLEKVKMYIETNDKLPPHQDINPLGNWISNQKINYSKQKDIMKEENIRNKWEDFINTYGYLFMSNDEMWNNTLEKVKSYIETNNKLPSQHDKNKDIKQIGKWISHQKENYSKQEHIMKEENIRIKWEDFMNTYPHLFMSNDERWNNTLEKVKLYIETNNKLPSVKDKNKDIKQFGYWISTQKKHYNKKEYIMKEENIRIKWEDFISTYSHLFNRNL
jgi:hypothetical protein